MFLYRTAPQRLHLIFTAADTPEGGNPPPAASTETCSPPLPHERRTSHLPLLPSGPCGVQRTKGVSGALQLRLSHRQPRGTGAHGSSRLPQLDLGTAPRASAPAYRRFRVPGDAEPPSLVRRHSIIPINEYIKVWYLIIREDIPFDLSSYQKRALFLFGFPTHNCRCYHMSQS
ncbi:MAG: hypothetical protein XD54_0573 [Thermococcus sibiricus]|uniref:Uncharacterized protein n=1 Tax=Thermococcus sibiricus TaxID=172049 RepID=A0A101EMT3_9EURY|nr:MAG: hypothetical protein XD54_0573 [Thermococcus sibiricus]KUK29227.1 MAG: hypothetical protein XD61_0228 [Thermococcus sp. 40_45]